MKHGNKYAIEIIQEINDADASADLYKLSANRPLLLGDLNSRFKSSSAVAISLSRCDRAYDNAELIIGSDLSFIPLGGGENPLQIARTRALSPIIRSARSSRFSSPARINRTARYFAPELISRRQGRREGERERERERQVGMEITLDFFLPR